jgi:hypothetical protein
VWGNCSTVQELQALVPPAARQPCSAARNAGACAAAAPACKWAKRAPPPATIDPTMARNWPAGDCAPTCNTTDRAACDRYPRECEWKAGACAPAGAAAAKPKAPDAGGKPAPETRKVCGGNGRAGVACAAEEDVQNAGLTLILLGSSANAGDAAAAAAPRSAAAGGRAPGASALAAAVAAAAGAAALLL